jgi:hypothetical protein
MVQTEHSIAEITQFYFLIDSVVILELLHHNPEVCWWKHYSLCSFSVWVQTINKNGKECTDQEIERF